MTNVATPRTLSGHWQAAHIFMAPGGPMDDFLLDQLVPALASDAEKPRWFFMRYGEGGSHLRVRLAGITSERFTSLCAAWGAVAPEYADVMRPADKWFNPSETQFPQGSVQLIHYDAEVERYGGLEAIASSETFFCQASALAVKIVSATRGHWEKRLAIGAALMIETACALHLDRSEARLLIENYAIGWRQFLERHGWEHQPAPFKLSTNPWQKWDIADGPANSVAGLWRRGLDQLVAALEKIEPSARTNTMEEIAMSHLHMMNNRIGVMPHHEYWVATDLSEHSIAM